VSPPASNGGYGGGLGEEFVRSPGVQGFVADARWRRIGSDFSLRHDEGKLRKTKKGRNKGSTRGKLRCETRSSEKPYSSENPETGERRRCRGRFKNKRSLNSPRHFIST